MSSDTDLTESTDASHASVAGDPSDRSDTRRQGLATIGEPTSIPEQLVEVRRRSGPAAALGAGASLVAVAYLARAATGGSVADWALAAVLGLVGVANLAALLDARTPLLVADDLGVRLRLGRTWVGLPWGGLHEVEHRRRRGWWRDGLLVVRTHYVQRVLEDLDPAARRIARLNRRMHGTPLAVPLGLGTRVVGAPAGLTATLRDLACGRTPVVESAPTEPDPASPPPDPQRPEPDVAESDRHRTPRLPSLPQLPQLPGLPRLPRVPDPRPRIAHLIGMVAALLHRPGSSGAAGSGDRDEADETGESGDRVESCPEPEPAIQPSETPAPARETVAASRAEVRREVRAEAEELVPGEPLEEDSQMWGELHAAADVEGPLLIDDYAAHPAPDPLIGPQFALARQRLGLSVDELADRTRIRPHVIESIEVDDFGACGGDFYARGHLRTLGRVLGVEAAPALATYDERYADAPIDPRRVFEAELAGAGSIRATRGGPNWSVLVAAVMALVLCWSVARLITGGAAETPDRAVLSGSGGPNHQTPVPVGDPVPVTLTAAGGGARVVVRDGNGSLVFSGDLAYGQTHTLRAATPVQVQSTDGSVRVRVNGQDRGRMGPAGRPASQSYLARGR